ncbi:MAG: helix-turn-helix transcriptional regulator [Burkholderiales bacterium]|nr:helix-turn-helix transcriptional regulator [Burkholderiales bacterium]
MDSKQAVQALGALAQETRLSIFRLLIQAGPEGLQAGQVREAMDIPAPTLSFHLKELSNARLASSRQEGRYVYYSADFEQMAALMTFLTQNCCRGMPLDCLSVMETELARCCTPAAAPAKSTTRSKS